jgi:hypothetical protein
MQQKGYSKNRTLVLDVHHKLGVLSTETKVVSINHVHVETDDFA